MLRQIDRGTDLNRRYRVRHGFRRDQIYDMTPLEAATANGLTDVVSLLVNAGAHLDMSNAVSLICFAQRVHAQDTEAFLKTRVAIAGNPDCEHTATPW